MISRKEIIEKFQGEGFHSIRFLRDQADNQTIVIASLPLRRSSQKKECPIPVSPFARVNHYKEAVSRLKRVSLQLRNSEGWSKSDVRLFSNSTLPEKRYAAKSGLGFIGRNSLIINAEAGSRIILAGMILPVKLESDPPLENGEIPGSLCGSCRNCIKSCPTKAIEKSGYINRDLCLQSLSTDERQISELLMEKWGNRLYGCTICQDCCPYNKKIKLIDSDDIQGSLTADLDLHFLLIESDLTIKEKLKGTALGLSWVKPDLLRRNGIISAASTENNKLIQKYIPLISRWKKHQAIGYAAQWAVQKLREKSNGNTPQ